MLRSLERMRSLAWRAWGAIEGHSLISELQLVLNVKKGRTPLHRTADSKKTSFGKDFKHGWLEHWVCLTRQEWQIQQIVQSRLYTSSAKALLILRTQVVEMAIPPAANLPSQASEVAYALPLAPAPTMQQMILPFAMAPVTPVTQMGAVTPMAPVTSMAPLPSLAPMAAMTPGPMPMPINLGMLPVLMSTLGWTRGVFYVVYYGWYWDSNKHSLRLCQQIGSVPKTHCFRSAYWQDTVESDKAIRWHKFRVSY